ncbi:MAG: 30S ribosomal protein S6 [Chloroflexi bacterium]|nr:MAG: 30S ribosomal protein S6 [Chloroflexota bacterium]MBL1193569.1 30S ribosomal protein S6 [Chloroflexota bacterium]NOH10860.1 30S ribosomal protein S6 [Chloroflexota bacterium]
MRNYEVVVIVHPDLDESAFGEVVELVKGWITEDGGTITNVDVWGKRRMAYEIRKQREGQYVLIHTEMQPEAQAELERKLRLQEPIMRFMVTRVEPA